LLIVCARHPNAPDNIFLVSDGSDMGLKELVTRIALSMNKRLLLVPVPVGLMSGTARLLGKQSVADRLLGSLQVDIADTCATLAWRPVITPQVAIDQTVAQYLAVHGRNKK
jgi:nucleoside-diphosphate-sugar epimerase